MKRAVVSGGAGYAGRFITERLLADGWNVSILGRAAPASDFFNAPVAFQSHRLGAGPAPCELFAGCGLFVHCAFDHLPGRYRGGEGDDPEGFRARNHGGSMALFRAAREAGVSRAIFLSSRAVYGRQLPGEPLLEITEPHPDTLYGAVKLETERALDALAGPDFRPFSLRVTGIYGPAGPGRSHKWASLFEDFREGRPVEPRVATEVHGEDVAAAVALLASETCGSEATVFNLSDILLDRRDLLEAFSRGTGQPGTLPERADASGLNAMDSRRLMALGWRPRGVLDLEGLT